MNEIVCRVTAFMEYPYLLIACALMMLFAAGLLISPARQRVPMTLSALLSTPFSLASFAFDPAYWHPERIIGHRLGIEDLMFSFATGGMAWLFAGWPLCRRMHLNATAYTMIKRKSALVLSGSFMCFTLWYIGIGIMTAVLISAGVLTFLMVYLRKEFLPVFFTGTGLFALFYLLFVKVCFLLFPDLISLWNIHALWGYFPWGIPLEELAWAALFGGTWPVMMLYVFGASPGGGMIRMSACE